MVETTVFCIIEGSNFSPIMAEKLTGIKLRNKNEPGDISQRTKLPIPFGNAEFEIDKNGDADPIEDAIQNLALHHANLLKAGANTFTIHLIVEYDGQCNFQIDSSIIAQISQVGANLTFSCVPK
jgi:hypothetical protein